MYILKIDFLLNKKSIQIIEHVHKRDVTRALIDKKIDSSTNFEWLAQMRLYFEPNNQNVLEQLKIRMANAEFHYGFEYLG